jgi:hypothetical protein
MASHVAGWVEITATGAEPGPSTTLHACPLTAMANDCRPTRSSHSAASPSADSGLNRRGSPRTRVRTSSEVGAFPIGAQLYPEDDENWRAG